MELLERGVLVKVMCKKTVIAKNGEQKGMESFTEGRTYMLIQDSWLTGFYGLGDITLFNNFEVESSWSKEKFDEHFDLLF